MRYHKIPDETVKRLPLYWRALKFMSAQGETHISSQKLSDISHINPWQIRKDLSYFGALGVRGIGYKTKKLSEKIGDILRLNGTQKAALVGVGNLGQALLKYSGFKSYGLEIIAAFDKNHKTIGKTINQVTIDNISKLRELKRSKIHIGIITVPEAEAQEVAVELVNAGVCGILNFAPLYLDLPKNVTVINIDIALDLALLPYYMPAKLVARRYIGK
jgi:redox-sensing transcriptional repressor